MGRRANRVGNAPPRRVGAIERDRVHWAGRATDVTNAATMMPAEATLPTRARTRRMVRGRVVFVQPRSRASKARQDVLGSDMAKTLTLPERQDADGAWHQVVRDVCYGCGCRYLIVGDDVDLVWEPGTERSRAAPRRTADVTSRPVIGERRL